MRKHSSEWMHPHFETQSRHHQKSKNRGIRGLTKRNNILQNFLKRTKEFIFQTLFSKRHLRHGQYYKIYVYITLISLHLIFSFIAKKNKFLEQTLFTCLIVGGFLFTWRSFYMYSVQNYVQTVEIIIKSHHNYYTG